MKKTKAPNKKPVRTQRPYLQIGQFIILAGLLLLLPQQNSYALRSVTEKITVRPTLVAPTPEPLPQNQTGQPPPELTAQGIVIVDIFSGVTLYEKNPDIQFLPASTTKIMTALVALTDYSLSDIVTVKTAITEGQVMGLTSGETVTVENLLYATLVHSANDAAYTLAETAKGGVSAFVGRMNELAKLYYLENTHFTNPVGFDDPNHYTTPKDLARLTRVAIQNPVFLKMVGIPQITVSDTTFTRFHALKNVNELLGKIPGIFGVKTGWTANAGQALVSIVQRGEHKVLIVVLKSDDRFGETQKLLTWVFNDFIWQTFSPESGFKIIEAK